MQKTNMVLVAVLLVVLGADAKGAGFEKSVMWSGREAGYAAAGMSRVKGAQALVFNPAGLAAGSSEASVNFSATASSTTSAASRSSGRNTCSRGTTSSSTPRSTSRA